VTTNGIKKKKKPVAVGCTPAAKKNKGTEKKGKGALSSGHCLSPGEGNYDTTSREEGVVKTRVVESINGL